MAEAVVQTVNTYILYLTEKERLELRSVLQNNIPGMTPSIQEGIWKALNEPKKQPPVI